jgi:hypothetical protein
LWRRRIPYTSTRAMYIMHTMYIRTSRACGRGGYLTHPYIRTSVPKFIRTSIRISIPGVGTRSASIQQFSQLPEIAWYQYRKRERERERERARERERERESERERERERERENLLGIIQKISRAAPMIASALPVASSESVCSGIFSCCHGGFWSNYPLEIFI